MVWPFMGYSEYMEIYSGYDSDWKLAYSPDYWIREIIDEKVIPTVDELLKECDENFGYVFAKEISSNLNWIVPQAMVRYNQRSMKKWDNSPNANGWQYA